MIIYDNAEKNNVHKLILKEKRQEEIRFNGTRCGDFTDDKRSFLVELKVGNDYLSSLFKKSLFEEMQKDAENFDGPKYLIFVGDKSKMIEDCAIGYGREKIPYLLKSKYYCWRFNFQYEEFETETEAAEFIEYMAGDEGAAKIMEFSFSPPKPKLPAGDKDLRHRIFTGLDGIASKEKCDKILEIYERPIDFLNECVENSKEVIKKLQGSGIGKKTIEKASLIYGSKIPVVMKYEGENDGSERSENQVSIISNRKLQKQKTASYFKNLHRKR